MEFDFFPTEEDLERYAGYGPNHDVFTLKSHGEKEFDAVLNERIRGWSVGVSNQNVPNSKPTFEVLLDFQN